MAENTRVPQTNEAKTQSNEHTNSDRIQEVFLRKKLTKTSAILESYQDFYFHVWTKPNSFYHAHSNYLEIFIVTEGMLLHYLNDQKELLEAGDAFLILPGQYHKHCQYKNYSSQHINLTCSLPRAAELFQLYFNTPTPTFPKQKIHLDSRHFDIVNRFQQIILTSIGNDDWDIALKSFMSMMIGLFHIRENDLPMPAWLQEFIQKLHKLNFDSSFKLSDLYASSNYSQTTLSREFKKYTGKTLIAYINDLKLNHACNQLLKTNFSMLTIATTSGFDSYRHFTRLFKQKFGVTPLQYRNDPRSAKPIER